MQWFVYRRFGNSCPRVLWRFESRDILIEAVCFILFSAKFIHINYSTLLHTRAKQHFHFPLKSDISQEYSDDEDIYVASYHDDSDSATLTPHPQSRNTLDKSHFRRHGVRNA